ncbi:MAG TPA: hypothetical protein PKX87_01645 [Alphaproteobacteria bacterium]|nr:hypothetical protein [Alphaproteobacteria bacterium]
MGKDKEQNDWQVMGEVAGMALQTVSGLPVRDFKAAAQKVMDNPAPSAPQPEPKQEPGFLAQAGKALDEAGDALLTSPKEALASAKDQYQKAFDARNNPGP